MNCRETSGGLDYSNKNQTYNSDKRCTGAGQQLIMIQEQSMNAFSGMFVWKCVLAVYNPDLI